jgi:hypothetical protein
MPSDMNSVDKDKMSPIIRFSRIPIDPWLVRMISEDPRKDPWLVRMVKRILLEGSLITEGPHCASLKGSLITEDHQ